MSRLLRWLFTDPTARWQPYMRSWKGNYSYDKGVEFGVRRKGSRLPTRHIPVASDYRSSEDFSEQLVRAEQEAREKAAYLNAMEGCLP